MVEGILALKAGLSALVLVGVLILSQDTGVLSEVTVQSWILMLGVASQAGQLVSVLILVELPVWLQTKALNMPALGMPTSAPPRALLRSFFIPGVNLYRPYLMAQRLWRDVYRLLSIQKHASLPILLAWGSWVLVGLLWLIRVSLTWFQVDLQTVFELSPRLLITQQIAGLLAALSTLWVVNEFDRCERRVWLNSRGSLEGARSPNRELGPRHGVLAVLVGVGGSYLLSYLLIRVGLDGSPLNLASTQICLAVCTLVILRHPQWESFGSALWRRTTGPPVGHWLLAAVALGVGLAFAVRGVLAHPLRQYQEGFRKLWQDFGGPGPDDANGLGLVVMALLVAPWVEEILFRGLVLPTFRLRWLPAPAVVASALLFSFVHGSPLQMVVVFFLGIACGVIRLASGGLWPAIVIHFVYNLLVTAPIPTAEGEVISIWSIPVGFLLIGVGMFLTVAWRPKPVNPLLHLRWWWGSESLEEAARVVAQSVDKAAHRVDKAARSVGELAGPATAALREEAKAKIETTRQAKQRSVQSAKDLAGRINRQGVRVGHLVLDHSAIAAGVLIACSGLFNAYWLSYGLIELLKAPIARDPMSHLVFIDVLRFPISSLAAVAFCFWIIKATERARSFHSDESSLHAYLPKENPIPLGLGAKRLLGSPRLSLGILWSAAWSEETHHQSKEVLRTLDGRIPFLFMFLAGTSLLCLPALFISHPLGALVVFFRRTLGPILAIILIKRASTFMIEVESQLLHRQEQSMIEASMEADQELDLSSEEPLSQNHGTVLASPE